MSPCNRQLIGIAAFFVAIGMLIMLFMPSRLLGVLIIALLLLLGYTCINCP